MNVTIANAMKTAYLDAADTCRRQEGNSSADEPTYSFRMLQALRDMASADVYPDGRFGDEECNIWSMFHAMKVR